MIYQFKILFRKQIIIIILIFFFFYIRGYEILDLFYFIFFLLLLKFLNHLNLQV